MTMRTVTAGSLRQIESIVGLLHCRGETNSETLAMLDRHLAIIECPVLWDDETRTVAVPEGRDDVRAWLAQGVRV